MKREEFKQQLQAIIPRPSPEMTASLYELGLSTSEDAGPQDILNTFDFIARNFDQEVLQSIYEISHHGPVILPSEMVTIAVLLQDGDTPDDILALIKSGRLKPLYMPKEMGEISSLAVCSFIENGNTCIAHTTRFGSFSPEQSFADAKEYAKQNGTTVTEAFQAEADKAMEPIIVHQPDLTEALHDIFASCPILAARITFDVDQNRVTIEYNPLWQGAAKELKIKSAPFRNFFGEHELTVTVCSYAQNGRLAVNLFCKEEGYWEPFAFLTVNLPKEPLKTNEAFIKDFDENAGLLDFVLKNQLGTLCPERGRSGFCCYPKIAFDMEKLREFDPEGTEKYLAQAQQKKRSKKPKER